MIMSVDELFTSYEGLPGVLGNKGTKEKIEGNKGT